jgi:hypothetical protein
VAIVESRLERAGIVESALTTKVPNPNRQICREQGTNAPAVLEMSQENLGDGLVITFQQV